MKFSAIFSGLVTALAFQATALPVANPDLTVDGSVEERDTLEARAGPKEVLIETDPAYKKLKQYGPSTLENGKYYALLDTTPRGKGDKMDDDAERIRNQLGYDHVRLVVGKYTETRVGKPPNKNPPSRIDVTRKWEDVKFWDLVTEANEKNKARKGIRWQANLSNTLSSKGAPTRFTDATANTAGKFRDPTKWGPPSMEKTLLIETS